MEGKEPMPQLEKDPLESKESDFNVNLKQLQGYTLKSQSTFVSRDKERVNISENAISLVNKFKNKLKDNIRKKKELAATT